MESTFIKSNDSFTLSLCLFLQSSGSVVIQEKQKYKYIVSHNQQGTEISQHRQTEFLLVCSCDERYHDAFHSDASHTTTT